MIYFMLLYMILPIGTERGILSLFIWYFRTLIGYVDEASTLKSDTIFILLFKKSS